MSGYRISRAAARDLDEIWYYIGRFDARAADRWLAAIERRFRIVAKQPLTGQKREDLGRELRLLPIGNYLVFYRPWERGVEIARVIHRARDDGPDFF